MRFQLTALERELAALPEGERAARLAAAWRDFRRSPHFDFVVAILRDFERQALSSIRGRPMADLRGSAMVLHVVDRIRRSFEALDTGEPKESVAWCDEEAFTEDMET